MHHKPLHTATTIRFRRWSRVGYAVFCSLACSVSIGSLSVSVSDKTLQKSVGTSSFFGNNPDSDSPEKLKEQAELELAIQQLQEITLLEKTFESAAACGLNTYFFNPTVEMS